MIKIRDAGDIPVVELTGEAFTAHVDLYMPEEQTMAGTFQISSRLYIEHEVLAAMIDDEAVLAEALVHEDERIRKIAEALVK